MLKTYTFNKKPQTMPLNCPHPHQNLLPNENGEYVCETCDRAFRDKEMLGKHLSCHDEEKPHECLECGKKFAKVMISVIYRIVHLVHGSF